MMPDNLTTETPAPAKLSCKNCGHQFDGQFCPSCGQVYIDKRFTMRESFSHFFSMVFNFDRGLWHTSIEMLRNPGKVLRDYLNGVTRPYFHPFRFLFLWLTIQVFLYFSTGIFEEIQSNVGGILGIRQEVSPLQTEIMNFYNGYLHIFITLSMPILAFGSWLFFKKSGYHYAEHLIINCFAYGETILITLLLLPVYFINSKVFLIINMSTLFISIGYISVVYLSFFEGRKWLIVLKTIGAYLVWLIGFVIFISVMMMAYAAWYLSTHPEMIEQMKQTSPS